MTESHNRSNAVTVCDCEPFSFHRLQKSVLQATHFELPSRDWEWLVREGNVHLSLPSDNAVVLCMSLMPRVNNLSLVDRGLCVCLCFSGDPG